MHSKVRAEQTHLEQAELDKAPVPIAKWQRAIKMRSNRKTQEKNLSERLKQKEGG